jgi:glucose-6-phosphate 1-dehydrogenase
MDHKKEVEQKSKERLKDHLEKAIIDCFSKILDYCEVAVEGQDRYKKLRSKVLRVSNDAIRAMHKEIDQHYDVNFVADLEDVLVFGAKCAPRTVIKRPGNGESK